MKTKGAVIFDIIPTCFSLDKPRERLVELGVPPHALELWFAQTLRDAFALSHAGSYRPLKEVLEAELPRTLKVLGIEADAQMRSGRRSRTRMSTPWLSKMSSCSASR